MVDFDPRIQAGHYARKQLACGSRLIAWSHRRRFATALRLSRSFAGQRVLDYGCGDGTFLALLMESSGAPAAATGAELSPAMVRDCEQRLARNRLGFVTVRDLEAPEHAGAYDVLVCMEVLEHLVDLEPVLADFERLLAPRGRLLISVPVETGPVLLVKQCLRRVAGWRKIGDYPGTLPYSVGELCTALVAGRRPHLARPVHVGQDGLRFHDHKGFNWRCLRDRLEERFELARTSRSPASWLPASFATQVWFEMRAR